MKWVAKDIKMYMKAKEYIDTAVIPLLPVSFGQDMKETASMTEFITLLSALLERQFTGRILLLPPFTYLKADENEQAVSELKNWTETVKYSGFKHVFYLTSESRWKMLEDDLDGSLLWVPALPIDQLEDFQKWSIMESQAGQLFNFFTRKWQDNE
ncbi:YpiF family protein [Bacillota bacterium Lsc_1132]